MFTRPSAIDYLMLRVEEERPDLMGMMEAIIREELDRRRRGDYTAEERRQHALARSMGKAAARTVDAMALQQIGKRTDPSKQGEIECHHY